MIGRSRTPLPALLGALVLTLAIGACDFDTPDAGTTSDADTASASATDTMAAASADTGALVNPNDAPEASLRELGLDSAAAAALIDGRPFETMIDVDRALSARMDSTAREDLYRRLFIPLDLNSASREEILLIPGVGDRMAHEFEEYRPYRGIEQFRREMGKYVDDEEVARLEKYVRLAS